MSGCGNPKELGAIFAVSVFLSFRLDLRSFGIGEQNAHCPAARIGTNFFSVLGLQPIGLLLNRLDNTWLTWGSVAPPFRASASVL